MLRQTVRSAMVIVLGLGPRGPDLHVGPKPNGCVYARSSQQSHAGTRSEALIHKNFVTVSGGKINCLTQIFYVCVHTDQPGA